MRHLKSELLNRISSANSDISFQYLGITERGKITYLWLTLNSNSCEVDGRFVDHVAKVAKAVREFAGQTWSMTEEQTQEVDVTKVDVTIDT